MIENPRGLLSDKAIRSLCVLPDSIKEQYPEMIAKFRPMIDPYLEECVREVEYKAIGDHDGERSKRKIISAGQSSYGYDIRLSQNELKVFTNLHSEIINPKKMNPKVYSEPVIRFSEEFGVYVVLPPNTGMLGHTVEYFRIPRNILTQCQTKSTYARAFISVIVTPLEPEWEGNLVVEIVNHTTSPCMIFLDEGIAQLNFYENHPCETSYADRGGKYQGQRGTQDAKV